MLRSVKTLDDLVGTDPLQAAPGSVARPLPGVQAVVIGDSTAAAVGNPAVDQRQRPGPGLRPQQRSPTPPTWPR